MYVKTCPELLASEDEEKNRVTPGREINVINNTTFEADWKTSSYCFSTNYSKELPLSIIIRKLSSNFQIFIIANLAVEESSLCMK